MLFSVVEKVHFDKILCKHTLMNHAQTDNMCIKKVNGWGKIFMYVPMKECCLFVIVLKFIKKKVKKKIRESKWGQL